MRIKEKMEKKEKKETVREHRRKKGIHRKEQLEIMDQFDVGVISSFEYS